MSKRLTYLRVGVVLCAFVALVGVVPVRSVFAQEQTETTEQDGDAAADADTKKDVPLPPGKVNPDDIGYRGYVTSSTTAFEHILNLIYTWSAIVATIVLIVAGYLFTTARGDPSQMKRSKDAIRGAVIGLVVVAIAFVITRFVIGGIQG